VHPITAVQTEYSLWTRDPEENGVLATCRELGIGFVPYAPLGRGFLSGRFTSPDELDENDFRRHGAGIWSRPPAFGDGAGGLVSTVDDLLAFARMFLRGGSPVLSAEAVRAMTSDQLTPAHRARGGLGRDFFDHMSWSFCQAVHDGGAFGWNGGFGSSWLVDPNHDLTVIVLTQRAWETSQLPAVHREIQAAAYAALARRD
jgi:CubicO group peptidase (beta-lactamase class C family)